MIPIVAVIPTRFDITRLLNLIPAILNDVKDIYIMDNGLSDTDKSILHSFSKITIIPCYDKSIYQMWNLGIDTAIKCYTKFSYTAILNDDIAMLPNTLSVLAGFLDHYGDLVAVSPDYSRSTLSGLGILQLEFVSSTFGHGGLAGFAFMIKNEYDIRVDEAFKWWYGDDDIVKQILRLDKKVGKVKDLPIDHYQGSSFIHRKDELNQYISSDRMYFNQKYGENR